MNCLANQLLVTLYFRLFWNNFTTDIVIFKEQLLKDIWPVWFPNSIQLLLHLPVIQEEAILEENVKDEIDKSFNSHAE